MAKLWIVFKRTNNFLFLKRPVNKKSTLIINRYQIEINNSNRNLLKIIAIFIIY
jgi:hypothetical protein